MQLTYQQAQEAAAYGVSHGLLSFVPSETKRVAKEPRKGNWRNPKQHLCDCGQQAVGFQAGSPECQRCRDWRLRNERESRKYINPI